MLDYQPDEQRLRLMSLFEEDIKNSGLEVACLDRFQKRPDRYKFAHTVHLFELWCLGFATGQKHTEKA